MIVIFGGAYQGKLDYAKEKFNICDDDVFTCTDNQFLQASGDKQFAFLIQISPKRGVAHRDLDGDQIVLKQCVLLLISDTQIGKDKDQHRHQCDQKQCQ